MKVSKHILFFCLFFIWFYVDAKSQEDLNIIGQWGGHIEFAERLEAINVVFENENLPVSYIMPV